MDWTEAEIARELDLMLAHAIMIDHVSGWSEDRKSEYKISLNHTWAQAATPELKRSGEAKANKAEYMKGYMAKRRKAKQAAAIIIAS